MYLCRIKSPVLGEKVLGVVNFTLISKVKSGHSSAEVIYWLAWRLTYRTNRVALQGVTGGQ